jgi:hypothetical protein
MRNNPCVEAVLQELKRAGIADVTIATAQTVIRRARARSVAGGLQLAPRRSPICWSLAARSGRDH